MQYVLFISALIFQTVLSAPLTGNALTRRIITNPIDPPPQDRPWVPGKDQPGQGPNLDGTSYMPGWDLPFSVNGKNNFFRDKNGFSPFGGGIGSPKEIFPEISSWPGGRPDPSNKELAATDDTPITWVGKAGENTPSLGRPDPADADIGDGNKNRGNGELFDASSSFPDLPGSAPADLDNFSPR
ncbi:hypothetical protein BDV33DRAFT_185828 [Aspergillus novoparasiticus]|uniref:Uncharacterized protein n=1 Tax=Aspergillus novoparasiticus TaxID=986946 RepID=A0A5N6E5U7_9EURO|nr:hypothetical protein BDV33DRAFT_185828 [Aspergillus novoparasiticus]